MAPNKYDSARRKLRRAEEHIDALEKIVSGIVHSKHYKVAVVQDPATKKTSVRLDKPDSRTLPPITPLIGDAVHNLRSALDHVAFEVLVPAGISPSKTTFPVANDVTILSKNSSYSTFQSIAPKVANVIGKHVLQSGPRLCELHQLDINDKHRELVTSFAVAKISVLAISDEKNPPSVAPHTLFVLPNGVPLTSGSPADLHNQQNAAADLVIMFGQGEPCGEVSVIDSLKNYATVVRDIIDDMP